jgi:hypothetical protein
MEERIIDEEYGRGVRFKKTAFGYVDVTDELAAEHGDEEPVDEVAFEFPVLEEEDEDLATLTPEEAAALRQKKKEEAEKRKASYEQACQEGEALLDSGEYAKAETKFEQALQLDGLATHASIGYWRAKTENFKKPDVLIDEYADEDMESMEYDLGVEALDTIRVAYQEEFKARLAALCEEEKPLAEKVEGKQIRRRKILSARLRNSIILFTAFLLPTLAGIVLTAVFGAKIPTTRENTYVLPTIISGGVSFVLFIFWVAFTNKLLNAVRIYAKNERLSSTEDGNRLATIRAYVSLYEELLTNLPASQQPAQDEAETEEIAEENPAEENEEVSQAE